jgi:hypothetical protein
MLLLLERVQMRTRFLKWWLLFVLQVLAVGVFFYLGGMQYLISNDRTFLCFIILGLWMLTSAAIGLKVFRQEQISENLWFAAESCMTLGMIGTVLGFIFMLSDSLINIDPSNSESMRAAISAMGIGMSTALLTTLAGLIANLFLSTQLVLQENKTYETPE